MDTHVFLEGGRIGGEPNATWSIQNGKLVVNWPNGWRNIYQLPIVGNRLSGESISPEGVSHSSTLVKIPE